MWDSCFRMRTLHRPHISHVKQTVHYRNIWKMETDCERAKFLEHEADYGETTRNTFVLLHTIVLNWKQQTTIMILWLNALLVCSTEKMSFLELIVESNYGLEFDWIWSSVGLPSKKPTRRNVSSSCVCACGHTSGFQFYTEFYCSLFCWFFDLGHRKGWWHIKCGFSTIGHLFCGYEDNMRLYVVCCSLETFIGLMLLISIIIGWVYNR